MRQGQDGEHTSQWEAVNRIKTLEETAVPENSHTHSRLRQHRLYSILRGDSTLWCQVLTKLKDIHPSPDTKLI